MKVVKTRNVQENTAHVEQKTLNHEKAGLKIWHRLQAREQDRPQVKHQVANLGGVKILEVKQGVRLEQKLYGITDLWSPCQQGGHGSVKDPLGLLADRLPARWSRLVKCLRPFKL